MGLSAYVMMSLLDHGGFKGSNQAEQSTGAVALDVLQRYYDRATFFLISPS